MSSQPAHNLEISPVQARQGQDDASGGATTSEEVEWWSDGTTLLHPSRVGGGALKRLSPIDRLQGKALPETLPLLDDDGETSEAAGHART